MAAALPRLAPKHWVYVDDQRTHEVHAQVAQAADTGYLVTSEFPMGSREPTELVQAQTPVRGEEELLTLLNELEDRLALSGRYFRTEASDLQWKPLAAPTRTVDLRAHETPIPGMEATGGRMKFHLFHAEGSGKDRLLISMPRPGMSGRHVLAEMRFQFPRIDEGELAVLHARLALPLLASAVAKEHVEAPRKGMKKLFETRDYEQTYGEGWLDRTKAMFHRAATKLIGGPAPIAVPAPVPQRHAPPERLQQMRAALSAERVEALKRKYLDAQTEAVLVGGGEHAIRKFIAAMRKRLNHQYAYDVSILEAALMCEYAIPSQMWDLASDEGSKLLRYLYGYDAA